MKDKKKSDISFADRRRHEDYVEKATKILIRYNETGFGLTPKQAHTLRRKLNYSQRILNRT